MSQHDYSSTLTENMHSLNTKMKIHPQQSIKPNKVNPNKENNKPTFVQGVTRLSDPQPCAHRVGSTNKKSKLDSNQTIVSNL